MLHARLADRCPCTHGACRVKPRHTLASATAPSLMRTRTHTLMMGRLRPLVQVQIVEQACLAECPMGPNCAYDADGDGAHSHAQHSFTQARTHTLTCTAGPHTHTHTQAQTRTAARTHTRAHANTAMPQASSRPSTA